MTKIKKKKSEKVIDIGFILLAMGITMFLLSIIFVCAAYLTYSSQKVHELGKEDEVTTLPKDINNVLGLKVGPNTPPDITIRIPILLYHYVEWVKNDPERQKLTIPPTVLTAQIETLKNDGYTFITTNDLAQALNGQKKLPAKVVILTFDDGYMDMYTDVFPILKKEQVKAVAYIVPNFLDHPNYMFTYQVKELANNSLIEIGAHTMDHTWLAGIASKSAAFEIQTSRSALQQMTGKQITSFAYPYGAFDPQAIRFVNEAGFTNAVSTLPGIIESTQHIYYLSRLRPGYRVGKTLLEYLAQDSFAPW